MFFHVDASLKPSARTLHTYRATPGNIGFSLQPSRLLEEKLHFHAGNFNQIVIA